MSADSVRYPRRGTQEFDWWSKGRDTEYELSLMGMSESGRQVYDAVQVMAQKGDSEQAITMAVAYIWGPSLRFRQRWSLAWQLVRPRRGRR